MSDWMSRARANAIAQDEALRRRRLGLPPASANRIRMQTNINSPAKPAGEGSVQLKKMTVPNVNQKFPVRSPTDPTFPEVIAAKKTGQPAPVRTRDAAGVRNSFANRDHELIKKQAEQNSEKVCLDAGQQGLESDRFMKELQQPTNDIQPDRNKSLLSTIWNTVNMGAGNFNKMAYGTLDVLANAIPMAEGWVFGEDKDATFTGQLLKPVTNITGKLKDLADKGAEFYTKRVYEDTEGKLGARLAAEFGTGVVSALPTAI